MRVIKHLAAGFGALLVMAAFIVGVPLALVTLVGWPLPTAIPSLEEIRLALRSGLDPQLIIKTLAVVVWVVWAQLVIVTTSEVAAVLKGMSSRRVAVLPGLQPMVARLIAAITLALATLGPPRLMPAAATPPTIEATAFNAQARTVTEEKPASVQPPGESEVKGEAAAPTYRVARHDTLWSIADLTLGDGRRWHEIRNLNTGRTMTDGQIFTDTTEKIAAGWLLVLPHDATVHDDQADGSGVVTVEPGDSFWTIAEDALAEAWGRQPSDQETSSYWHQLVDINRDALAPPYEPDLIYPGQQFQLPPIPRDVTTETSGGSTTGQRQVTVQPGDSFWTIAESALMDFWDRVPTNDETRTYWKDLIEANRDRLAPPHDPNLIFPGQTFVLPAIPGDATSSVTADSPSDVQPHPAPKEESEESSPPGPPATPPPPSSATPPVTSTPAPTEAETIDEPTTADIGEDISTGETETDSGLMSITSRLAGLAVLAAGLVALLRRLRAAQLRHRRPDTIPTPPAPESRSTESMVRTAAVPTDTELVDLALRVMARDLVSAHVTPPDLVGVHMTPDALRVLLWNPRNDPPQGWHVEDEGRSWLLPTNTDISHLRSKARGVPAPYPALVTVGHGGHTQLLLNLEYLGATQITGEPDEVLATCYTMATELATTPLADDVQVICVGFGSELAQHERIRAVESLDDLLRDIETKAEAVGRTTTSHPVDGRFSPANDGTWDPIIVVDPSPEESEDSKPLLNVAHAGKAVAALVGYPTGDRWQLHVQDGTVRIEPLGYTFARRNLTAEEQTGVTDLVAAAMDVEGVPADLVAAPLPGLGYEETEPNAEPETIEQADTEGDTTAPKPELKVLGAIRVDGLERRFPLLKCTELIAYLVFHRRGIEAEALMEALWPEEEPDYQRLNRHTSRARVTLGKGPDGEPYVPFVTDGIYQTGQHLRSDFDRFTSLVREAEQGDDTNAARLLHAALELVEARPFSGAGAGYVWAHAQGVITHTIVAIDNAAHRLAKYALTADEPDEATWAARKGLLATESCEQCYRNLMRAALAGGNQVAFEAIYKELLAFTDADDGPDTAAYLEPETIELYEQARRNRRRQAG